MRYDIEVLWRKTIKHAFSKFHTLIEHGFLTNQSARRIIIVHNISREIFGNAQETFLFAVEETNTGVYVRNNLFTSMQEMIDSCFFCETSTNHHGKQHETAQRK